MNLLSSLWLRTCSHCENLVLKSRRKGYDAVLCAVLSKELLTLTTILAIKLLLLCLIITPHVFLKVLHSALLLEKSRVVVQSSEETSIEEVYIERIVSILQGCFNA